MDWTALLAAVIGAVLGGGLAGSLVSLIRVGPEKRKLESEQRKTDADAAGVLTESAMAIVAKLETRINELESDVADERCKRRELEQRVTVLERERAAYRGGALALVDQVRGLGADPVWVEGC